MSEREQFEAMLTRCGIPFSVDEGGVVITCDGACGNKGFPLQGYYLFYAQFHFDADGQLLDVGIFE